MTTVEKVLTGHKRCSDNHYMTKRRCYYCKELHPENETQLIYAPVRILSANRGKTTGGYEYRTIRVCKTGKGCR